MQSCGGSFSSGWPPACNLTLAQLQGLHSHSPMTEPECVNRFADVWLWSEWPGRAGRPDTGIDLVAKHRDSEGYAAIEVKLHTA